ncbi:MAG: TolC family protein [Gemmatimonadaceae bacterium]
MTSTYAVVARVVVRLAVLLLAGAGSLAAQATAPTRLSLGDAARLAARQNAGAEQARFRAQQAEARIAQRRADILPNVSAVAVQSGRTFNSATFGIDFPSVPGQPPLFDRNGEVIGPNNAFDVRGRVSENLIDFGAYSRIKSARTFAAASTADAASVAEQSASQAAVAYLRALRADAQIQARMADSVLADSLLGIAREQVAAGVGVGLDVTRAQAQLASIRAQLISARNERDRSHLDLQRAVGLPADAPIVLSDSLDRLPLGDAPGNEAELVRTAMRSRPDLRAAALQLDAANEQVTAIRAERLPTIGILADVGFIGAANKKFSGATHLLDTYTWALQLSLPIFEGGRREGRIQEQRAVANEVATRRRDLEQAAAIEVRGALLDLASAREQVGAARERLRLAEQEVTQARDRFRAGVAGNADVITASLLLNTSRTQLVDALANYQSARLALARAEGTTTTLP